MTNEEKKEYLNLKIAYHSTPFMAEIEKKQDYISKTPRTLYKYRKFDDFSFDMIENDYVFLASTGSLDDPFDCLTDIDLKSIYKAENFSLTKEMNEYIIDIIFNHPHSEEVNKEKMIALIEESTIEGRINYTILKRKLDENNNFTNEQKNLLLNTMKNFKNTISTIINSKKFKNLFTLLIHSKEKIGVCSFTTKRDNRPMWSLYADRYKGYCVEYKMPIAKDLMQNLYPVIYTKDFDNNIVNALVKFTIEVIIRFCTNGKMKTELGCFAELICTKDSDWEYQDEWRLIGDANTKLKPFKIKAIYLGFDVDENNEKMILDYAARKGFNVYKMNKPINTKKITYIKL